MAEIVLFHSALGLRPGVTAAADQLRGAGHSVHVPDYYDGEVFDDLEDGLRKHDELGVAEILRRAREAVRGLEPPSKCTPIPARVTSLPTRTCPSTIGGPRRRCGGARLPFSTVSTPDPESLFWPDVWPFRLPLFTRVRERRCYRKAGPAVARPSRAQRSGREDLHPLVEVPSPGLAIPSKAVVMQNEGGSHVKSDREPVRLTGWFAVDR
jgi:hypothetical protein